MQSCIGIIGVTQVPVPLHASGLVKTVPVHDGAWHWVPLGQSVHAPAPLQPTAELPQLAIEAAAHWLSGSVPALMAPHTPLVPPEPCLAAEQAWQVPLQAVLQQKPSTQNPLAQSADTLQTLPCAQRVVQVSEA